MKKILLSLLTSLTLLPLYSLPVSNPTEAAFYRDGMWVKNNSCEDGWNVCNWSFFPNMSFRFGYYGDFVFDRNLEIQGEGFNQGRVIQETKINTNAGLIVLNICDAVDLFATLGASRMTIATSEDAWNPGGNARGTLYTNTHFSWSLGAKAPIFHWKCINFGLEGQYFQTSPKFIHYISSFVGQYTIFENNNQVRYREWQIGGVMDYTWFICNPDIAISPYIAGKWSHAQLTTHNFSFIAQPSGDLFTIFDLKNHKSWGFAFGTTLSLYNVAGVTIEGRVGDELAVSANAQFSF